MNQMVSPFVFTSPEIKIVLNGGSLLEDGQGWMNDVVKTRIEGEPERYC